jgi:hypothetical protein
LFSGVAGKGQKAEKKAKGRRQTAERNTAELNKKANNIF